MSEIKALEWEEVHQARSLEDPNTELQGWEAMTGFGCGYYIEIRDGRFRLTDHLYGETTFEDPDEAKAAAQADYEARIRSALVENNSGSNGETLEKVCRNDPNSDPKNQNIGAIERKAEPVAWLHEDATPAMIAAALAVDWSNESEEATAHNVWHAFRSSLSASPSPVDSRELSADLMAALSKCRTSFCGYSLKGDYEQAAEVVAAFYKELMRIDGVARAALLAAKEQQP